MKWPNGNLGEQQFQSSCCDTLSPKLLANPVADKIKTFRLEARNTASQKVANKNYSYRDARIFKDFFSMRIERIFAPRIGRRQLVCFGVELKFE